MKKTDWAILASTAAYSFLFYEQHAGINGLLFTLLLVVSFFIVYHDVRSDKTWYFYAFCAVFSSVFLLIYSSDLALFSLIVCWLLLSARAVNRSATLLNNLVTSTFSVVSSVVFFVKRIADAFSNKRDEPNDKKGIKVLIYIVSVGLLILFFSLYKKANPLFENYTKKINLDFISVKWVFFTIWGFLVVYGMLRPVRLHEVDSWELRQEGRISEGSSSLIQQYLAQGSIFLFIVLNLMLLFINLLDINFLYLGSGLPDGITHKQFVHKGVNNLILSIVLGISVILYVFKGQMHFDSRGKFLKALVYLWLLQNAMMVFSTALRNHMYITEALLTYKRIGVYYWLALAFSGLITTYTKLVSLQRNWYLIRSNSWVAFILLVSASAIDWDLFISRYNLSHSSQMASLDKKYLLSLSEGNIGLLYPLRNSPSFETDSIWHYQSQQGYSNRRELDGKVYHFLKKKHDCGDWRSFNVRENSTHQWILSNRHLIDTMDLSETHVRGISCLKDLDHVKALYLPATFELTDTTVRDLSHLPALETLGISSMTQKQVSLMRYLPRLKILHIRSKYAGSEKIIEALRLKYPDLIVA